MEKITVSAFLCGWNKSKFQFDSAILFDIYTYKDCNLLLNHSEYEQLETNHKYLQCLEMQPLMNWTMHQQCLYPLLCISLYECFRFRMFKSFMLTTVYKPAFRLYIHKKLYTWYGKKLKESQLNHPHLCKMNCICFLWLWRHFVLSDDRKTKMYKKKRNCSCNFVLESKISSMRTQSEMFR